MIKYEPQLTEHQINNLIDLLQYYKGDIVPISVIKRELNISSDEIYNLLINLTKKGYLEMNFKIWCEHSSDTKIKTIYRAIEDIPLDNCDICEKGCKLLNNIIIVFRVVF